METMKRFLGAPPPETGSELAALRKRVAELEARLKPSPRPRRKPRKH
jgi:BMFP domain-containing protein YqiC